MTRYSTLSKEQLINELKRRGLRTNGAKKVLIERLIENDNDNESVETNDDSNEITVIPPAPAVSTPARDRDDNKERENDGEKTLDYSIAKTVSTQKLLFSPRDIIDVLPDFMPENKETLTAQEWIKKVNALKEIYEWPEKLLLFSINARMKGTAKTWIDRTQVFTKWNDFANEFLQEFSVKLTEADIHIKLINRKRGNQENLVEYLDEMIKLALPYEIKEESIIKYYILGMKDEALYNQFQSQHIRTLNDLREKVKWCTDLRNLKNAFGKTTTKISENIKEQKEREIICFNCKKAGHMASKCTESKPFACFNCHQPGHMSKDCPSPQRRNRCSTCNKVHRKGMISECESTTKQRVGYLQCELKDEYHKVMKVKNSKCIALVDTGADCSMIKKSYAEKLDLTKHGCRNTITGFTGGITYAEGKVELKFEIDDVNLTGEFYIMKDEILPTEILIGKDVLNNKNLRIIKEFNYLKFENIEEKSEKDKKRTDKVIEEEVEIGTGDTEERKKIMKIVNEYKDLFARNMKEIGCTHLTSMKIELENDKSVQQRAYRIPYPKRERFKEIINELLENDIIERSTSGYASPALLVSKKNGSDRLCVDYRSLNKNTKREISVIPNIEEQLVEAAGYAYYTVLDMNSGFYQVRLDPDSMKYTAFITPEGLYEFKRMPFGLKNAPAVFQRLMAIVLKDLNRSDVCNYMDDLLIPANNIDEMITKMEKVFRAIRKANLTLNLKKCEFLKKSIEYLGHEITSDGIKPGEIKTRAISEYKRPENATEVKQFLGLCGFFRKFIPGFALIAQPLNTLLHKNVQFDWKESQEQAFLRLKELLTERPVLGSYDMNADLEIHTDASKHGVAGILLQRKANEFKPLAYFSRATTETERNYHSYELEALAVVTTLERFRYYVQGKPIKVITDCAALKTTMTKKELIPRIARWWLRIQEFDIELEHRSGKSLSYVDALSRTPVEPSTELEPASHEIFKITIDENDYLYTMQIQDPELQIIINKLKDQRRTKEEAIKEFDVINGRLYRKVEGENKWVVPKALRGRILRNCHDEAGHLALEKTLERVKGHYWFPKMRKFANNYIKSCIDCAYNKQSAGKREGEYYYDDVEPIPFKTLHIDHLGPFPRSSKGNIHILNIVDRFTKYTIIKPVRNTSTNAVIKTINEITGIVGNPARIISDRGSAFTSKAFERYCKENGIKHVKIAVRTPRANGQVERMNKTLISMITTTVQQDRKWDDNLREIQWVINTMKNQTTGKSPHDLVFNYDARDILRNRLTLILQDESQNEVKDLETFRINAAHNIKKNAEKRKVYYDQRHKKPKKYEIGDLVLVENEPASTGTSRKLEPKFKGPYIVSKTLGSDRYLVEDIPHAQRTQKPYANVYASDNMKSWCTLPPDENFDEGVCSSQDEDDDDDYNYQPVSEGAELSGSAECEGTSGNIDKKI